MDIRMEGGVEVESFQPASRRERRKSVEVWSLKGFH